MRQDEQTQRYSRSFGAVAADYDRLRPAPPDPALEWLLPPGCRDVLEIGAGTGLLTRQLVARVDYVLAVEPDDRMRLVLAERVPGAVIIAGVAEELVAQDRSVDVVIASSAWHWVDEERAVPEVARILRPGGFLSLLWCGPDRSIDWMRALWAGGETLCDDQAAALDARRRRRHQVDLGAGGQFLEPESRVIRWTTPMSRGDLVGLAGTYSAIITMDPDAREGHFEAMHRYLDTLEHLAGEDVIDVPMRCLCWRAARR